MLTRISNPALLTKSNLNLHRDQGSIRGKGVEVLLDTSGIFISTSYSVDDRLLHLYSDKKASHIGVVLRGKMTSLYTFDKRFNAHFNYSFAEPFNQNVYYFSATSTLYLNEQSDFQHANVIIRKDGFADARKQIGMDMEFRYL